MDGILNIDKPAGITSHDVVQRVRSILGEKRVGHTGTLDPMATGVLVLCIGRATRIARYLEAGEKEYRAVMRLGQRTDTLDADGRLVEAREYVPPESESLRTVMQEFTGVIMQSPPAFSAVKIGGIPSYKLARQGKAKPNRPRSVMIRRLEMISYENPFVTIAVECSKGVYIRSLCADIGDALGMGAHLTSLVRTRSGKFMLDHAVTLERLEDLSKKKSVNSLLTTIDEALDEIPRLSISDAEANRVVHGNEISRCSKDSEERGGLVRLHDSSDRLLSLARREGAVIRPELVFHSGS